ncbi:hypothetical protein R3P38DRAFT_3115567 [Favolaschia claudopus]|uniref:Mitochondrial intermembrane space cysteine motif-containing protein MIX17 n=1 Tax=Favolaschia claudopus TaxID=2862362 RepID=A0AAV9ZFZ9_9AGAR
MARQSRGRSSSSSRAAPAQTRTASTAAAPAGYARAPAPPAAAPSAASAGAADKQPGMLAQMAATAGSVAIGSTIGHGLSSMLFGGGGNQAAEQEAPPAQQQQQRAGMSCEIPAKDFTMCLEKADMPSCTYYLEQLKACQAAAAPY